MDSDLTYREAKKVISNFKTHVVDYYTFLNPFADPDEAILSPRFGFFNRIDDLVSIYGVKAVGTALEVVRTTHEIDDIRLYYITWEGSSVDIFQEEFIGRFLFDLEKLTNDVVEELKREEEKEDKKEAMAKEDINSEYYRVRSNLLKAIGRRRKAGLDLTNLIPKIPTVITAGSVRKLAAVLDLVKTAYRYLSGRGYKGGYD